MSNGTATVIERIDRELHPCFNKKSAATHSRVHLPVAPGCNIQCAYCNRKIDCVNESRPGVSSKVLNPEQAEYYADEMIKRDPDISVIGIAGPGDAFNNPENTIEVLRRIRKKHPSVLFCLSTNGLDLEPWLEDLNEIGVSHITVTVNAVDPLIGSEIYSWIRYNRKRYLGVDAARILLERQEAGIRRAAALGITIKVNTLFIPGINDYHIPEVTATVKAWGAEIQNIIPFMPVAGSKFENHPAPEHGEVHKLRLELQSELKQMTHCGRCRADAAGKLAGGDMSHLELIKKASEFSSQKRKTTGIFGVATREGILVNQHLGEAEEFFIFKYIDGEFQFLEKRPTPASGEERWLNTVQLLNDCDAVMVSGAGPKPSSVFASKRLPLLVCEGMIEEILEKYSEDNDISIYAPTGSFSCQTSCSGNATGCS